MRNLRLDNITETAVASFGGLSDARQRELVQALLQHLHGFAKDVGLTHAEWRSALGFLHRVGDISSDSRSEFSLLSDVTGLSSLVDMLASDPSDATLTPGSNLGPFHASGSPWKDNPANLIGDNAGRRVLLRGRVLDQHGAALPQATLDFWQNAADGLYWQQDPKQATDNLRCQLKMDAQGAFEIATIRPVPYQIPLDGPVWHELVQPAGLSGWRPAHYHLIASAPGHRTLVTELFDAEDPYLDKDAVFGVRETLVGQYETVEDAAACTRLGVAGSTCLVMQVELRLAPEVGN
jgi:protocatechuate 3,4-dioxygenase beta subunit